MVVQHNISAMNANRYYGINNKALAGSLEKLSSGYAINRAGDNAAGLAVSEKMRAQIGGLTQASKNAEDGISMVQTFEGALQETDSILQRMRTLAVQSANGNYQNEVDRDAIQLEFDQLNDELNQIADTDFNGVVMLNGGVMADGTVANNSDMVAKRPKLDDVGATPDTAFTYKSVINGSVDSGGNGSVSVNGVSLKLKNGQVDNEDHKVTLGNTEYSADVSVTNGKVNGTITAKESYAIDSNTTDIRIHGESYTLSNGKLMDSEGNSKTEIDGLGVTINSNSVTLEGNYTVSNSTVNTAYRFNDETNNITGALTQNPDGTFSGSIGTNGVSANANGTPTTTGEGITYTASGVSLNTTTGAVAGTITVGGTVNADSPDVKNNTASITQATNGSGNPVNGVYTTQINGVDAWITDTGNVYNSLVNAQNDDGSTGVLADTDFSKGGTLVTGVTVNIDSSTSKATGVSFTSSTQKITIDGKDYNYAVKSDGTAFDNKVLVNGVASSTVSFGPNNAFTANIAATSATAAGSVSIANNTKAKPDEVGTFKLSNGVSTSDAYSHGARNLTYADSMTLQVGARAKDAVNFNFDYTTNGIGKLKADLNASARGLGTDQLSVKSSEEANYAIDQVDNAINKVNMIRATFGAVQNRLEHKINNIDTNTENLTAAESRIRDTQMDKEMMKFTSSQILSQASQSMLAQANSLPQGVLQLLG